MKLGFWTLGMPAWPNGVFAERAAALGYDGVDIRCTNAGADGRPGDEGNLSLASSVEEVDETLQAFVAAGVEISSLLLYSPAGYKGPLDWDVLVEYLAAHAGLAERLGARLMRVQVGHPREGEEWVAHMERLWKTVQEGIAATPSVGAVFENHPGTASATQLLEVAERMGDPRIGVEFSPDHTLVMQEDTLGLIHRYAPWIHQVCYADRKLVQEDLAKFDGRFYEVRYESCGIDEGDVPAAAIFEALAEEGFDGYVSLKWEKSARFGHHLPPGDQVLGQFAEFMRQFGVIDGLSA